MLNCRHQGYAWRQGRAWQQMFRSRVSTGIVILAREVQEPSETPKGAIQVDSNQEVGTSFSLTFGMPFMGLPL